ncbi:MAG: iron ABC transporter permease [Alphaproteobacteria bacterium]|jgi:iron complex transport system permease protein|nr:iron ABC transporter permease [Alphaproteobacteria bacterium]MBU2125896.1 iron ABC transporter permease [Alphaproteobacteria bacterium]MBU2208845.1 iron ABC transporter permease [Alphaproteobacteria bacterium]MBU2291967.1 iron ABC transporter permease [Alphaproteobacteria bacterium]MBU2397139.1 iron ABC transporter permease [Alphaproteobacteria bacterium]
MSGPSRLTLALAGLIAVASVTGVLLGESAFSMTQLGQAFTETGSGPAEVLWQVRAPRVMTALMVGAALGLSGAVMQGLLRNPLADPGVLGVSAAAALAAAAAIVLGAAAVPGAVEISALIGAGLAGGLLILFSARVRSPEALILFGVAVSSFAGAATALIFNLSPSPIATAEVMNWLLGSVQNRSWIDVAWVTPAVLVAGAMAALAAPGLRMLSLGEETARTSGLPMARLRLLALLATALATGAAVAVAGVIGFVGLAAPHLVRSAVRGDPGRLLLPSALAGGLMLVVADLLARMTPTDQELKLGVFTALVGAPLFALIAWRAAREWRL